MEIPPVNILPVNSLPSEQSAMRLLIVISHPDAAPYVCEFGAACHRKNVPYSLFFTGDGVVTLSEACVLECAENAAEAVVCEHTWEKHKGTDICPLALGSQTDHSRMVKTAGRLVSL